MAAPTSICISHTTGAGGAEVGRLVAEQLGLRYVDDEVIGEAAEWAGLDPAFVADAERRKSFAARLLGGLGGQGGTRLPSGETARALPSDADLRALITDAVGAIVREGGAVVVAHAASFAVAPGEALRVFVTASPSTRSDRLAGARDVGAEDAGRADYLKRFYGVEWELPTHYDLVVNTDALSPAEAASVVAAAASR